MCSAPSWTAVQVLANRADVFDGQVRIANRLIDPLGNLLAAVGTLEGQLAHFVGEDGKAFWRMAPANWFIAFLWVMALLLI